MAAMLAMTVISATYPGRVLCCKGILNGGFMFSYFGCCRFVFISCDFINVAHKPGTDCGLFVR